MTKFGVEVHNVPVGVVGATVASWAAAIDAYPVGTVLPDMVRWITWNLGVNEMSALPAEAAWKANALYIADALHARYPNARIYVMQPWECGPGLGDGSSGCLFDAEAVTVASWYADVVAARPAFMVLGPDEHTFLPGLLADGIHPTQAGYFATADEWEAVITW